MIIPFCGFVTGWINLEMMINGWYGPIESNEEFWPVFSSPKYWSSIITFCPLEPACPIYTAWGREEKLRSGTAEAARQKPCWEAGALAQTQPDVTSTDVSKTVPSYSKGPVHKSGIQRYDLIASCEGEGLGLSLSASSTSLCSGQRTQRKLECIF